MKTVHAIAFGLASFTWVASAAAQPLCWTTPLSEPVPQEVDLPPLPGAGGIGIHRYYHDGAWHHGYDVRLQAHGKGYRIVLPQGENLLYHADTHRQGYVSTSPLDGLLTEGSDPAARHRWDLPCGQTVYFNAQGQIGAIVMQPSGALTQLFYQQGQLQAVIDPQGRALTFQYRSNRDGQVLSGVQAPTGLVRYEYESGTGRISKVHLPTYFTDNHQSALPPLTMQTVSLQSRSYVYAPPPADTLEKILVVGHGGDAQWMSRHQTPSLTHAAPLPPAPQQPLYNPQGLLISSVEGTGTGTTTRQTVYYRYEAMAQRWRVTQIDTPDGVMQFGWDNKGRFVETLLYPSGQKEQLQRHPKTGRITQFTLTDGSVIEVGYSPMGQIRRLSRGSTVITQSHDANNRLTHVKSNQGPVATAWKPRCEKADLAISPLMRFPAVWIELLELTDAREVLQHMQRCALTTRN